MRPRTGQPATVRHHARAKGKGVSPLRARGARSASIKLGSGEVSYNAMQCRGLAKNNQTVLHFNHASGGRAWTSILKKIAEAAFRREFEQDENVVRSLPFFATALGVVVAIFSQTLTRLPASGVALGLTTVVLAGSACVFLMILWCLFQIVRAREFMIPPNEKALVDWAAELDAFHRSSGLTAKQAEGKTEAALRRVMIEAYSEAAVHNREIIRPKFLFRTRGLTWLIILMALATLQVGVIFLDQRMGSAQTEERQDVNQSKPTNSDAQVEPETPPNVAEPGNVDE